MNFEKKTVASEEVNFSSPMIMAKTVKTDCGGTGTGHTVKLLNFSSDLFSRYFLGRYFREN